MSVKKITREDIEDFVALVNDAENRDELNRIKNRFFGAIDSIQSELEAMEGRNVMTVDWDSLGDSVKGLVTIATTLDEACASGYCGVIQYIHRPLPPKVTGERKKSFIQLSNEYATKKAVNGDIYSAFVVMQDDLNSGKSIIDLCIAAGIDLWVEE